ncbi:hypothetical protein [Clostridium sp. HBUAS56010]|uniref:hypothetical protein n=1 Tax=Clostridium sp. HBUAS56010 TaxID=2571127 RepID=UPI00117872A1|nr:hypothetical protein [Clostridium sp. HBUAS56010]
MAIIEELISQHVGNNIIIQTGNEKNRKLINLAGYSIISNLNNVIVIGDKFHHVKIDLTHALLLRNQLDLCGLDLWFDGIDYTYRLYITKEIVGCEPI